MPHYQVHSMTGVIDHGVGSAGSANMLVGVNSSGTPLEYKILQATANTVIAYINTGIQLVSLPDFEELIVYAGTTAQWASMPQAVTEFFGGSWARTQFSTTYMTSCRMLAYVSVIGSAGAYLFAQASTDSQLTWVGLGSATTSPSVLIDSATTMRTGNWIDIRAGHRRDMYLRVAGSGGDGAISPMFGKVAIQFY